MTRLIQHVLKHNTSMNTNKNLRSNGNSYSANNNKNTVNVKSVNTGPI